HQGRPQSTTDPERQGMASGRTLSLDEAARLTGERRIAGEPHPLSFAHAREIRSQVPEAQNPAAAPGRDAEDGTSGLIGGLGSAGIEDDAHAGSGIALGVV